jgi:vacuolar-type H+-ATPase subunit H
LEAPLSVDIKYLDNKSNEIVDYNKLVKDFVKKSNKLYRKFIEKMDKPIKEKVDNILNSDNAKLVMLDKSL